MRRLRSLFGIAVTLAVLLAVVVGCATPTSTPAPAQSQPTAPPTQSQPTTAPAPAQPTVAPAQPTTAPAVNALGLPEVNPVEVKGDIVSAGSSTVYPLSEAIAEMFQDEGYAGNITIDSIGSGAGFERFCKTGDTDISNASRPIKESEVASCQAIGREPIAFRMGTDALAVVVSKENTFLTDVTLEELGSIFSSAAAKWSDVNPSWPNEDIRRFSPGTDSGTFDFFVEVVLKNDKAQLLNAANLQLSEDDNVLVQGVEGSPYAIGYFGYAYLHENQGRLKAVAIEGVEPGAAAVEAGTYKLARPLFIYSDAKIMQSKPQVASFIAFYLSHVNDVIGRVGYFPASDEALNATAKAWLEAVQ